MSIAWQRSWKRSTSGTRHVALGNTVGHCSKARLVVTTVLRGASWRRATIVEERSVTRGSYET